MAYFSSDIDSLGFFEELDTPMEIPTTFNDYRKALVYDYLGSIGSVSVNSSLIHYYTEVMRIEGGMDSIKKYGPQSLGIDDYYDDCQYLVVNSENREVEGKLIFGYSIPDYLNYCIVLEVITDNNAMNSDQISDLHNLVYDALAQVNIIYSDIIDYSLFQTKINNLLDYINNNLPDSLTDINCNITGIHYLRLKRFDTYLSDGVPSDFITYVVDNYDMFFEEISPIYGYDNVSLLAAYRYSNYYAVALIADNFNSDDEPDDFYTHNTIWLVYSLEQNRFFYQLGYYREYEPNRNRGGMSSSDAYKLGCAIMLRQAMWNSKVDTSTIKCSYFEGALSAGSMNLGNVYDYNSIALFSETEDIDRTTLVPLGQYPLGWQAVLETIQVKDVDDVPEDTPDTPETLEIWFGVYKGKIHYNVGNPDSKEDDFECGGPVGIY